ncbi:hypothetical protein DLE01_10375, partial [Streptomyces sp. FT05W]
GAAPVETGDDHVEDGVLELGVRREGDPLALDQGHTGGTDRTGGGASAVAESRGESRGIPEPSRGSGRGTPDEKDLAA